MSKRTGVPAALAVTLAMMLSCTGTALAVNFEPGPGTYTVDTTALTLTGPGTSINGTDQGGVAVFAFDAISIPIGTTINVTGARPFKLVAAGDLALGGVVDGSGVGATNFIAVANPGGPGGGAGGADGTKPGSGAGGGGVPSNNNSGAGGGGFGGAGAIGGAVGGNPGLGGPAYGDVSTLLQGGSGGGGSGTSLGTGGGGGGGAVALVGASVRIVPSGKVLVNGGGGTVGGAGASGGGSGGGLLVYSSTTLQMDGLLSAAGGPGGVGGCCGGGGGGGGGRIALQYKTLSVIGTIDVSGGISNSREAQPCGCGTGVVGQPAGAAGIVSKSLVPDPPPPTPTNSGTTPVKTAPPVLPAPAVNCVVPKLAGKKVPAAKEALKKAHCLAGKIRAAYSKNAKKGRVIGQGAKVGKVLPADSKIGIKVSKGPPTATT